MVHAPPQTVVEVPEGKLVREYTLQAGKESWRIEAAEIRTEGV